ncbi:hypothetical protein DTO013E5_10091 [Penicillium roqueforti]|nr:uncharacterized protein LCP9604111_9452 [Penicillium roqueforti]KAF9238426.1 hypothetical protein LCP9604111_9452 [Penicillium roqueforti]KAI1828984.1 hypothetical protein CBS147337_10212 [Penicillium roqueforti]KAI2672419.1 hypothetical protein CBS147355_8139 [Penicillium roqueforti]KAI2675644.1 hypothetical protein LCP963914a_8481 [Penicillium roqueforti]KAI2694564.1 hypothetical protein CBS147372_9733 [Penicillium roqueforti]
MDLTDLDLACFDVECAVETIGSSAYAILSILARLQSAPDLVTEYAKFTNVPPDIAELILSNEYRQLYDRHTRSLIVTIPGRPHDALVGELHLVMAVSLANMRRTEWSLTTARVEGGICAKEPDGSWIPRELPPGRSEKWPTVILEVGVSEAKKKLRADADWWLANSEGQVHVVITIAVSRTVPEVTFETVVLEQPPTYIMGQRRYVTQVRQSIVVFRPPGGPITAVPDISPLIITLQQVPETDPVIPIPSLESIASAAWRWQEL